jgi:hypothetical protein
MGPGLDVMLVADQLDALAGELVAVSGTADEQAATSEQADDFP